MAPAAYFIAGLSFLPLVGVVFGLIAIGWGLVAWRSGGRAVAVLGSLGVLFTVAIYSALFKFGISGTGAVFGKARQVAAVRDITVLAYAIEYYRSVEGRYPESLTVLERWLPSDSQLSLADPSAPQNTEGPRYFFYEKVDGNSYDLLGVGSDGKPFTEDDIHPKLRKARRATTDLLVDEEGASG